MMSQQEMSDRWEIQDLVFHYADLIDSKNFDGLREVFTGDAHVDYSAFGGSVGDLEETIAYLKQAVADEVFPNSQHLNANVQVALDGDRASGRVMCFNPMEMALPDGGTQVFLLGLWYVDEYRRTPAGWRIARREEEKSWVFNTPDFMQL
ncbi:nuclear transport factor 2 family protein [Parahaliea mediterranea]|uniref:Nuclear transport factor 2 family protein n=1 Tax=Parahaliea mediterranea TaxID=651086 RepID=A0A939DIY2_9GAMM|nr:nuclear transport factor 2 family protein [Parahaliea mediterranea]MBN7798823.1 nuclear transport factor 2 family protein [Parahaliea mediterranea]